MPCQRLDDESLYTLLCEIEAIMNSRPLTYISTSQNDLEALTPSHLLLLRGSAEIIPGQFSEADSYSRRRWRCVQFLADQFWKRWRREFLPTLQSRQKWTRGSKNLQAGDIVLLTDETVPRGTWPMARVVQTFPSQDSVVRKVLVKTSTSEFMRPVQKLVLVLEYADLEW